MEKNMVNWLIEKSKEEKLEPEKQIEWLTENYELEIKKKDEIKRFLKKNHYLTFAMNYLETFKNKKLPKLGINEIIDFVKVDGKINFVTLVYFWKIRTKIFESLTEMKLKNVILKEGDNNFEEIVEILNSFSNSKQDQFCSLYGLEKQYFKSFLIHVENIGFLKKEILNNNGTLYAMKDENITYTSLFEYVYFCIKYLLNDRDSFQYMIHIKENINTEKLKNEHLLNDYKKHFNFIEWKT